MISAIESPEIILDRPRHLRLSHFALFKAESELNRLRNSKPGEHCSIDFLMVDGFNKQLRLTGLLPLDLLFCMLWAALLHEDPKLTLNDVGDLLDQSPLSRAEICAKVWEHYFLIAGKNLKEKKADPGDAPDPLAQRPGATSGARGELH